MNVYAYQLDIAWEDKGANFQKVREWTSRSEPQSGSLLVLPELFATGFSMDGQSLQEPEDGLTESFLKELARDTSCYVLAGLAFARLEGKPTNDALLINPEGIRVGQYSKIQPLIWARRARIMSRVMMFSALNYPVDSGSVLLFVMTCGFLNFFVRQ